jgi:Flp pilus assembly protein TadB
MWIAALLGLGTGTGVMMVVAGLWPRSRSVEPAGSELRTAALELVRRQSPRRWAGALSAGTGIGFLTGWPVAALLTVLTVLALPSLLRPDREARARTARIEAVAVWAEMLRDTLSAAAGLEQAIRATAETAPEALHVEINALVTRIDHGERLPDALRAFADDVDDPLADLVVAALLMAAERQARNLGELLGSLASATREQVTMRLKTEADRARIRTSVRVIISVTIGMAFGLMLVNRPYLAPFGSATGQVVLALIGVLFGLAFTWLSRLARLDAAPRILRPGQSRIEEGRR